MDKPPKTDAVAFRPRLWSSAYQKRPGGVCDQLTKGEKQKRTSKRMSFFVVREAGVEPARPCEHWHLKPASLPIPPLALGWFALSFSASIILPQPIPPVNTFSEKIQFYFLFPSRRPLPISPRPRLPVRFSYYIWNVLHLLRPSYKNRDFPSCLFLVPVI